MSVSEKNYLPSWLTKDFLEKAFRSYKKDESLEILSYNCVEDKFDNHFGSDIYCVEIIFKTPISSESKSKVIVKLVTDKASEMGEILQDSLFMRNEIKMYLKSIPMINDLLIRHDMKCQLAPDLIYAALEPHPVLILKNMREEGFSIPKHPMKNVHDIKMLFKRIAQFHAASYHLVEDCDVNFDEFSCTTLHYRDVIEAAYVKRIRILKDVVATWEGYEDYVPRLEYIAKHAVEIGRNCYIKNKPGVGYNVLNHGNLHFLNILTKQCEKTKQLEDFQFIDFQESSYCSPAYDFGYAFSMIHAGGIDCDEIVSYYHEEFVSALKKFGHTKSIPTLLDLKEEISQHSIGSMLIEMIYIPAFFYDQVNFDDIIASNEVEKRLIFKKKVFNSAECKNVIQKSLKLWLKKGYFEENY